MTIQTTKEEQTVNEIMNPDNKEVNLQEYANSRKAELRNLPEVQDLNSQIVLDDTNTILTFGKGASDGIAKISDSLLNNVKLNRNEDKSQLLKSLSKVMDEFDMKDFEEGKEPNFLQKLFRKSKNSLDDFFKKYDTMGGEIGKIEGELRLYENDIKDSNRILDSLLLENMNFYHDLQKYIVAGELALEEMERDILPVFEQKAQTSGDQLDVLTYQNYKQAYDMIAQRVYDLQVAETIALQTIPMLKAMQFNNYSLVRKINSAFVITLPVFKQGLTQAVLVKKQKLQAEALNALDEKTNEMLVKNANNIVNTSNTLTRMNSTPSIKVETLQSTYNIIKNGIEETLRIEEECRQKREADRIALTQLNKDMIALNNTQR